MKAKTTRRTRAVAAVNKIQRQSMQNGANALSSGEIAAEIKAVRKARRRREQASGD
ncbi:MAG: hypothetical protein AAB308_13410 [Nitrospirota bacterium]